MNKGIYFAAFTALLWGFLAIAIKLSLDYLPPITVVWARFLLAFLILLLYYQFTNPKHLGILVKPPTFALLAGIALGFNYFGFISGIHYTSPSVGQIFIQSGPVLLALSGFVFFKERVTLLQGIGLLVVVLGLVVFYNEQIVKIAGGAAQSKLGVVLVLFGAVSWALYAVFQKIAVRTFDPMQLNLVIFGLPALAYTPFVEFSSFPGLSWQGWGLIIFLGLNTLGAYGSLAYALKYLEANKISVIITLNPLITFAIMAWLSYKQVSWIEPETFTLVTVVGALIVIFGVVLTVRRNKNRS